jgi:uncharacterized protein (TIGR00251 family)
VSGATDLYTTEDDGIVLRVHVQPGAGRSAIVGRHGDALKVRVAAPPVDDRANEEAIGLVAEMLEVKPRQVSIVDGERSRLKRLRVSGVEVEDADARLRQALDEAKSPAGPRQRRTFD